MSFQDSETKHGEIAAALYLDTRAGRVSVGVFGEVRTLQILLRVDKMSLCYVLTDAKARTLVNTNQVFEAILFDPADKAPLLGFWTNEGQSRYGDIQYFSVELGTELLPGSLAMAHIPMDHVLVVRYLGRLRITAHGQFYLENQTLLGYAYMPLESAREILKFPPLDPTNNSGEADTRLPLPDKNAGSATNFR